MKRSILSLALLSVTALSLAAAESGGNIGHHTTWLTGNHGKASPPSLAGTKGGRAPGDKASGTRAVGALPALESSAGPATTGDGGRPALPSRGTGIGGLFEASGVDIGH